MKYIFLLLCVAGSFLTASGQKKKIPDAVQSAFEKMFPGAEKVVWGKENAHEYEAEFRWHEQEVSANFQTDGSWVETETVIPAGSLPQAVSDAVEQNYPQARITRVEKLEQPGKQLYEVSFMHKGKKHSLEITPDGRLAK